MNKLVIAILLIAIGQVAHSYSPYNKIESKLGNRDNQEDDDDVDLGQLFNPKSETETESSETGYQRQARPYWGHKGKQHYRDNYQGVNDYEQISQYGQYQGQGQSSVASKQQGWPWQQHQQWQSHYGSNDYDSDNNHGFGVKGIQSSQDDYQYQNQNQHEINPQDSHFGSMTRNFLNQAQQTYQNARKRVFHPDEQQQQGGGFVVNQQGKRENQQDSDENDAVDKKNSVRGSYL